MTCAWETPLWLQREQFARRRIPITLGSESQRFSDGEQRACVVTVGLKRGLAMPRPTVQRVAIKQQAHAFEGSSGLFSCGLIVERTTMHLLSRSNQNGAPSAPARAGTSQP